jgi:hypothetical protein
VYSRTSQYDAVTVAGKVVMHYEDGSDTRPQSATYGRSLWLYDVATSDVLHVAFGASKPAVVHRGGRAAMWMTASAHTVWFEQIAGRSSVSIWRIDRTTVRLLARPKAISF